MHVSSKCMVAGWLGHLFGERPRPEPHTQYNTRAEIETQPHDNSIEENEQTPATPLLVYSFRRRYDGRHPPTLASLIFPQ